MTQDLQETCTILEVQLELPCRLSMWDTREHLEWGRVSIIYVKVTAPLSIRCSLIVKGKRCM